MLYYYKWFAEHGKYSKITVDDSHAGTKEDPMEVMDFCMITKRQYKKETDGKESIYEAEE